MNACGTASITSWPAASATTARCPTSSPMCRGTATHCEKLRGVSFCLMIATTLHSIAVGNPAAFLGPRRVRGHRSLDRHQAGRPGFLPDCKPSYRRGPVPAGPGGGIEEAGEVARTVASREKWDYGTYETYASYRSHRVPKVRLPSPPSSLLTGRTHAPNRPHPDVPAGPLRH